MTIEIQAHAGDLITPAKRVAEVATTGPTEIFQDDTFFRCSLGWLKLRTFSNAERELMVYSRVDQRERSEATHIRSPPRGPDGPTGHQRMVVVSLRQASFFSKKVSLKQQIWALKAM